jgi:hypothetical protein
MKLTDKDIEHYRESLKRKGFTLVEGYSGEEREERTFTIRHVDSELPHRPRHVAPGPVWAIHVKEGELWMAVYCIAGGWYSREYWTHVASEPYAGGRYEQT